MPTTQSQPVPHPPRSRTGEALIAYFYSGWAFLIPYLLTYLLYAWLKWPVNPSTAGSELASSNRLSWVPCLLHVYWFLHAMHVFLGLAALKYWWQKGGANQRDPAIVFHKIPSTLDRLWPIIPWLLLALIFWIPGVYLEWPSDPWEHLRRINEWRIIDTVGAHSSWMKSAYFFPYCLLSWCVGIRQLFLLDFYYTGICLMLCWQYYKLSRSCGLGERASMVFVIIQTLLFGNNTFSFYRYYGISSSIYAQLGAIAFTRIALEFAARGTKPDPIPSEDKDVAHKCGDSESRILRQANCRERNGAVERVSTGCEVNKQRLTNPIVTAQRCLFSHIRASVVQTIHPSAFWHPLVLVRLSLIAFCLFLLIAFNHPQGLGIAGLGILAVAVWRIIEWNRAMVGWLALAAALASIAVVQWFPRNPVLDEVYRPQGWLTAWYGFNLWTPTSPAFERSLQILGVFGAFNLVLGLWLILRCNHIAGWLALTPVIALALPCFALPFSHLLATKGGVENIITFHRFLFAAPTGLALVATFSRTQSATTVFKFPPKELRSATAAVPLDWTLRRQAVALVTTGLIVALSLSPGFPTYTRFWHTISKTPDDLRLKHQLAAWTPRLLAVTNDDSTEVETTILASTVMQVFRPTPNLRTFRPFYVALDPADFKQRLNWLLSVHETAYDAQSPKVFGDWATAAPSFLQIDEPHHAPSSLIRLSSVDEKWITLSGYPHQQTRLDNSLIIQNPLGSSADVFNAGYVSVSKDKSYLLTVAIRQTSGRTAANFLAVAWYDSEKRPLVSNQPGRDGANFPSGWENGTYSYYGLVGSTAPVRWTRYTKLFGRGTHAAIPPNAAFARFGALLNFETTLGAQAQIADLLLTENVGRKHVIWLPPFQLLYSPASVAGQLSGHWTSQRVAADHAGTQELRESVPSLANLPAVK